MKLTAFEEQTTVENNTQTFEEKVQTYEQRNKVRIRKKTKRFLSSRGNFYPDVPCR